MEEVLLVSVAVHDRWRRFYWSVWYSIIDGGGFIGQYGRA